MEFIRDGESVATLMTLGQKLLGRRQVLPGVAELIHEVQVEATFPDGTKLLTVHEPIASLDGARARSRRASRVSWEEGAAVPASSVVEYRRACARARARS